VSGIRDPPGHCNPAGGIVGSNGASRDRCRPMIYRSEEQPATAQLGEDVARAAPAAPAPDKYPAIAAIGDDEAHAIVDWAAAPPTTPVAAHIAELGSDLGRSHWPVSRGFSDVERQLGSPSRKAVTSDCR
jgi:hypothetical protein